MSEAVSQGGICQLDLCKGTAEKPIRLLIVGKTGSGKSSLGNTILGEEKFDTKTSFESATQDCKLENGTYHGTRIDIMDSPGLFDTKKTQEEVAALVAKNLACMHPGPTAILYAIPICSRFTEEEKRVYERLKAVLDWRLTQYMIVVFTRGDDLKRDKKTIDDVLATAPDFLRNILEECSHRYVVFDNTADEKQSQVDELIEKVRRLREERCDQPYTCPTFFYVKVNMEEELKKRLQKVEEEELKNIKFVQELEKGANKALEEVAAQKREFEKLEKERDEKIKKEDEAREKEVNMLMEILRQQKVTAEKMHEREIEYRKEMEKRRLEETEIRERQRQDEQEALRQIQLVSNALIFLTAQMEMQRQRRFAEIKQQCLNELRNQIAKSGRCSIL